MQGSLRGCRHQKGHCSSYFGSVGCVCHDWPFGSPSTATPHFRNRQLGIRLLETYGFCKAIHLDHFSSHCLWHHSVTSSHGSAYSTTSMLTRLSCISLSTTTAGNTSINLATWTTAVYEWLLHNCLALNPYKLSESAVFGTVARTKSLHNVISVNVTRTLISLSHCVKSLGVIFDENQYLTSVRSVRVVSSISEPFSIYVHRCPPKQQRWSPVPLLPLGSTTETRCLLKCQKRTLTNWSSVCPSMVTGMPAYSRDHMIPVLAKLHWLPVRARVSFKITMMTQVGQPTWVASRMFWAWNLFRHRVQVTHVTCSVLCTIYGFENKTS